MNAGTLKMAICEKCGKNIDLAPPKCEYCSGTFCYDCLLPKEHNCSGIEKSKSLSSSDKNEFSQSGASKKPFQPTSNIESEDMTKSQGSNGFAGWLLKKKHEPYSFIKFILNNSARIITFFILLVLLGIVFYKADALNLIQTYNIPASLIFAVLLALLILYFLIRIMAEFIYWYCQQTNLIRLLLPLILLVILLISLLGGLIAQDNIKPKNLLEKSQNITNYLLKTFGVDKEVRLNKNSVLKDSDWIKNGGSFMTQGHFPYWSHDVLSYKILPGCGKIEEDRIKRAFFLIENSTASVLQFQNITEENKADITLVCYKFKKSVNTSLDEAGLAELSYTNNRISLAEISLYDVDPPSSNFTGNCPNYPDVEMHEVLHVLGFSHTTQPQSIMASISRSCDKTGIDSEITEILKIVYTTL